MTVSKLDIETAIHETMSVVMALAELVEASLTEPDRRADGFLHFAMTPGQVDARLAMTAVASDKAVALRDLFQAYMLGERERKVVKA
ncbi:hypothetical protein [Kaistia adipata]|uniref:hypothetical protein n=1 Tax=Kaistia adipata TaxID=166954 RepID=UPI000425C0C2|nr:hypothetical protein [Kaistia adipata]